MQTVFLALTVVIAITQATVIPNYLSAEYIKQINEHAKTWTAGSNFPENTPLSEIKKLLGAKKLEVPELPLKTPEFLAADIPATFDARDQWQNCSSIKQIRDQSACGSCWAVAAASAISDRICIASNGAKNIPISASDLTGCCSDCGDGCEGGYSERAWNYWKNTGIVTGGEYGSGVGCKPYPFPQCAHVPGGKYPACPSERYPTPECTKKCDNSSINYANDLNKGKSAYRISDDVAAIQQEILTNGPVQASFTVYSDFLSYKSGVYHRSMLPDELGNHAVKILGWGTEDGSPYWLVANSWNEDWGDKGTFKIRRDFDECGFEDQIVAGLPSL